MGLPMAIQDLEASNLKELVGVALEIRKELVHDGFLWYRGISCSSYELVPKIMRDGRSESEVFEREKRLLTRFRQRSMAYWPSGYPQKDWEHLFAMQHYGIPTRLLDWSENLFVASFFALSPGGNHNHTPEECAPVVWCFDPVRWNRATPALSEYGEAIRVLTTADEDLDPYRPETGKRRSKSPVALFGTHNSDRIVAQRGTFMIWGAEVKSLEDYARDVEKKLLWRIRLTGDRGSMFTDLQALGFSETMVFPELPYLAAELSRMEGWRK
jgi:hypothetical protein